MDGSADAMDIDDMDIDLGVDPAIEALDMEAMNMEAYSLPTNNAHSNDAAATGLDVQKEKVYIRGLDNLSTEDIKRFASEHFPPEPERIEWIDDTSANIQYPSAELATNALASFTSPAVLEAGVAEPLQLRLAKSLSTHQHVELFVRPSTVTDVKKPRAYDASRFYLMNPDKDPRERRRLENDRRGRREYRDRRLGKRAVEEESSEPFDVNLYDDDPQSLAARIKGARDNEKRPRQPSTSKQRDDSQPRKHSGSRGELFSRRSGRNGDGRLRDRSVSPTAGGDGRLGFEGIDESRTRLTRRRSFTPPTERHNRNANAGKELLGGFRNNATKELFGLSNDNVGKELMDFNMPKSSGILQLSNSIQDIASESIPAKTSLLASGNSHELFPGRGPTSNHRRKAAFDAADGTGDLFANRMSRPLRGSSEATKKESRGLAERITSGSTQDLASRITSADFPAGHGRMGASGGFNIRGSAAQEESPGFSIRGVAGLDNPRVKELFPERSAGNEGKELFGQFKGRSAPRKTAEDMFT